MTLEKKVDLTNIQGSGPGGRVVRRDIEKAMAVQESPVAVQMASLPLPPTSMGRNLPDQTLPMSKLRTAIARRMAESKTTIPHFYVTHEYDVAALLDLRKQLNAIVPENEKLSVNDFIVKAVALTLRQFPNLNASLNGNSVIRHRHCSFGGRRPADHCQPGYGPETPSPDFCRGQSHGGARAGGQGSPGGDRRLHLLHLQHGHV